MQPILVLTVGFLAYLHRIHQEQKKLCTYMYTDGLRKKKKPKTHVLTT